MRAIEAGLAQHEAKELVVAYESKELVEYAIGMLQGAAGRVDDAVESMNRALLENLAFYPARASLAELALARSDMAGAIEQFEEALRLCPDDAVVLYGYGRTLLRQRRYPDAVEALQDAVALEPYFAAPRYDLARALEAARDRDGARARPELPGARLTLQPAPRPLYGFWPVASRPAAYRRSRGVVHGPRRARTMKNACEPVPFGHRSGAFSAWSQARQRCTSPERGSGVTASSSSSPVRMR